MATIRPGSSPALLIVDVQVGVMAEAWDAERVIGRLVRAVERAREQAVPVIWVQHADDELPEGSDAWQLRPELRPAAGEPRILKHFNSSFEQTSLDDELDRLGVSHLVLAGAATNWCIRATAYAALERGYDLTLVKDAHTTASVTLADGRRIEAADLVDELNIALRWLSYPQRVSGTATAETVDFHRPGGGA